MAYRDLVIFHMSLSHVAAWTSSTTWWQVFQDIPRRMKEGGRTCQSSLGLTSEGHFCHILLTKPVTWPTLIPEKENRAPSLDGFMYREERIVGPMVPLLATTIHVSPAKEHVLLLPKPLRVSSLHDISLKFRISLFGSDPSMHKAWDLVPFLQLPHG